MMLFVQLQPIDYLFNLYKSLLIYVFSECFLTIFQIIQQHIINLYKKEFQVMQNAVINMQSQSKDLPARPLDFSFINQNNQIISSLLQFKRLPEMPAKQTTEIRGYEWTFKKPEDIQFDYKSLKRLQTMVAQTQQKLKIDQIEDNRDESSSNQQNKQYQESMPIAQSNIFFKTQKLQSKLNQQIMPQKIKQMQTKRFSTIIMKENKQQFIELNILLPNVYEDEVIIRKNSEDYKEQLMNVCGTQYISFSKTKFDFNSVSKLKIYPQKSKGKCFKIKLVHRKVNYFLGVQLRRQLYFLPKHYIWFAKLINSKLMHMKYKVELKDGNKLLDTNYGLGGIFAQGTILKCSKYKKKWQTRHVVINTEGIFSFIKASDNYTISIPTSQLQELWTNFQTIKNHLIIKLAYNKGKKIQFAIPIQDFCLRQQSNWLFAFYRILMEHTIHIKCLCG